MDDGGACCLMLFGVPLYLAVSGGILQAACALYNRLVGKGSAERVPAPGLGRAMFAQLVYLISALLVGVFAGAFLLGVGRARGVDRDVMGWVVGLQLTPLALVVLGAALAGSLPTTFSRGLLAAMCYFLLLGVIMLGLAVLIGLLRVLA